jgi:hypothetical protein
MPAPQNISIAEAENHAVKTPEPQRSQKVDEGRGSSRRSRSTSRTRAYDGRPSRDLISSHQEPDAMYGPYAPMQGDFYRPKYQDSRDGERSRHRSRSPRRDYQYESRPRPHRLRPYSRYDGIQTTSNGHQQKRISHTSQSNSRPCAPTGVAWQIKDDRQQLSQYELFTGSQRRGSGHGKHVLLHEVLAGQLRYGDGDQVRKPKV